MEGCRYPEKNWPRADNFKQHLKRVHNIQLGDNDLDQYTYTWATSLHKTSAFDIADKLARSPRLSLAPEFAGLGTVIDDNLPAEDGNILNAAWMDLEMPESCLAADFSHEDVSNQQPYHILHSGDFPTVSLEISPTERPPEPNGLQVPESRSEWQNSQSFAESVNDASNEFVQYLGEDPMCQNDSSENGHCSVLYDETEQTRPGEPILELRHADQQTMQISREPSVESEDGDVPRTNDMPHKAPPSEGVDIPPTSRSPERISSGSNCRDSEPADMLMETQARQVDISGPLANTWDIVNDDKQALRFIKALKEKGMLTDLLEKLGYQIPHSIDSESRITGSARDHTDEHNFVCHEDKCTKSFTRRCELKYVLEHHHM